MTTWTRALVTGASAGIGKEFARQLAADGTDLVLVARSTDRLEELAAEVTAAHGVAAEVLTADLLDRADVARVAARITSDAEPVDLVVNNAGFGSVGPFTDTDVDAQVAIVDLNINALVHLTHAAATTYKERGAGGILNVASLGAFQPVPLMATYTASKAMVKSFTEALHEELDGTGVHVTALCPGFTRTEFAERAEVEDGTVPDWMWMGVEPVVAAGLKGIASNRGVVLPGLGAKVIGNLADQSPSWLTRQVSSLLGKGL